MRQLVKVVSFASQQRILPTSVPATEEEAYFCTPSGLYNHICCSFHYLLWLHTTRGTWWIVISISIACVVQNASSCSEGKELYVSVAELRVPSNLDIDHFHRPAPLGLPLNTQGVRILNKDLMHYAQYVESISPKSGTRWKWEKNELDVEGPFHWFPTWGHSHGHLGP